MKKILLVASYGGHWVQLRRLEPAFEGMDKYYVTINPDVRSELGDAPLYIVPDAHLDEKIKLFKLIWSMLKVLYKVRPDVVISTGAAPGFFAIVLAKMFCRSKTIWVDSIANAEQMSVSGLKVRPFADLWLTQWSHLAKDNGPYYSGAVFVIFVTVGSQLPFDRLVKAVDVWAETRSEREVYIQLGATEYIPKNCKYSAYLEPDKWETLFRQADVIISHAGMGTIIKSLEMAKPLVVMPRLAELNEVRNDHQLATVQRFQMLNNLSVVQNDQELKLALDKSYDIHGDGCVVDDSNLRQLHHALQEFIRK